MTLNQDISGVSLYLKIACEADKIIQCGVADLIVLIANDKTRLLEAAKICDRHPLVQLAACDVARTDSIDVSLTKIVEEIEQELPRVYGSGASFNVDIPTTRLHILDLGKAAEIKEFGTPDLLIILDEMWATLDEAVALCKESPEVQRETCKLVWSHHTSGRGRTEPKSLCAALQEIKD